MAQRSQKVKYLYFKVLIRDTKIFKRKKTLACSWNNWLHLLKTHLPQNPITCLQNFSLVLSFMVFFQQETSYVSQTDQNLANYGYRFTPGCMYLYQLPLSMESKLWKRGQEKRKGRHHKAQYMTTRQELMPNNRFKLGLAVDVSFETFN